MVELFHNDKEDVVDEADVVLHVKKPPVADARRRLEDLLAEKRLQDELADFMDYDG